MNNDKLLKWAGTSSWGHELSLPVEFYELYVIVLVGGNPLTINIRREYLLSTIRYFPMTSVSSNLVSEMDISAVLKVSYTTLDILSAFYNNQGTSASYHVWYR